MNPKNMGLKEIPCQRQSGGQIMAQLGIFIKILLTITDRQTGATKKLRQTQQLVLIRRTGAARHRPPAARTYIA